jgi:MoxR-like ATPase
LRLLKDDASVEAPPPGVRRTDAFQIDRVTDASELLALRQAIEEIHVDPDIERYIVRLVDATRRDKRVVVGASPRGSLALLKLARVQAALEGRAYVLPDDVKSFARAALIHRLILTPDLWMQRRAADGILEEILRSWRMRPTPALAFWNSRS